MSFTRRAALIAATIVIALGAFSPLASAHSYKAGDLEIGHPWTRATPPSAKVAGGFLTITNTGKTPDRLISATFTGSGSTEVHEMKHEGGIMKMRELTGGIEVKPGETLALRPGSYHLMFMGLKDPLKENDRLKGELVFEKAGRVEVEFKVESIGYRPTSADDQGHTGHHEAKPK